MPRVSPEWYDAYLARRASASPSSSSCPVIESLVREDPKPTGGSERDLQQQAIEYCNDQRWICLRGSMAHRTFRVPGEPDHIIIAPNRVLFVEYKVGKGKLSPDQLAIQTWMATLGHDLHVVRSFKEFLEVVHAKATD